MKYKYLFVLAMLLCSCVGRNNSSSGDDAKEEVITLFSDSSRVFIDSLEVDKSCLLKTFHHKNFGEIPYVLLDEYCETFDKTDFHEKKNYAIKDNKFIVSGLTKGSFVFDAETDMVTSSDDCIYLFEKTRNTNNTIPFDFYRWTNSSGFVKESTKTKYLKQGSERVYDCKKYNFDIVYEKGKYYAPFALLTYLFYGHLNTAFIYNGKNFFDCDFITGELPELVSYCYSSNGDFLLDRSLGKLGAQMFKKVQPKEENESYRFESIIESSQQLTVFSLNKDGKGTLKTFDSSGHIIDEGVHVKVDYQINEAKTELEMKYYSVLEMEDTEPISDITTLKINLDQTYFNRQTRSQIVADYTYQELRFAFYELYGNTKNTSVKDFDNFIKNKDYKDKLLSLDISEYDDAMSKLLLEDVDDAHTRIHYPSIYGNPTFVNSNYYAQRHAGERRGHIIEAQATNQNARSEAGALEGFQIVNKTAFITFDSFSLNNQIKAFDEYKNTNPSDYISSPMDLFASSFNKIQENANIENVVIDLSCNGGGQVASLAYLLGYCTKDPAIIINTGLNDADIEFHYEVDLNQDGIYAGEGDSFAEKYNFYVLTSEASFSCANHFATLCRNLNFGKVIGQTTGGGSCIVSYLCNSSGYLYHCSSEVTSLLSKDEEYVTNDCGVTPDIEIDSSQFYNRTYIDSIL